VGKIKNTIKRIDVLMPQYHSSHTDQTGQIKITPFPWWRRLFPWIPYFVGDRVIFQVEIERLDARFVFYEKFGDQIYEKFQFISGKKLRGSTIPRECDVEYVVAPYNAKELTATNSVLVMSANVINKDRWALGCAGLLIGGIITFIVTIAAGIVTGFFEIDKFWHIINPFWK
jgi:hypothetical protein